MSLLTDAGQQEYSKITIIIEDSKTIRTVVYKRTINHVLDEVYEQPSVYNGRLKPAVLSHIAYQFTPLQDDDGVFSKHTIEDK